MVDCRLSIQPSILMAVAAAFGSALSVFRAPLGLSATCGVAALAVLALLARRGMPERKISMRWAMAAIVAAFAYLAWGTTIGNRRAKTLDELFGDGSTTHLELVGTVGSDIESTKLKNGGIRYYFTLCDIQSNRDGCSDVSSSLARHGAPPVRVAWFGHKPTEGETRPVPHAGDIWCFKGKAKRTGRIPARYAVELSSGSDRSIRLLSAPRGNLRAAIARMRAECSRRLSLGMGRHRDESAMAQAILLGYRDDIPFRLNRVFRDSGTMHVFAISGMHVMIVAGCLTFLLGPLGIPRTRWFLVVCPALVAYTVATGAQPSAMRACLMSCLYLAAPLFGRRPNGASAISTAAIVLLAWNPSQIANAGFLLSFTVVAGLIALATPLSHLFRRFPFAVRLREDEHALWKMGGEVEEVKLWRARVALLSYRYVADLFAVSIVAWIASAPLTAWYFGRLTPCAILANLAIVPLALVVVVSGCAGMALASVSGHLALATNQIVVAATSLMAWVARMASAAPGLVCKVPEPPGWMIAAWYLAFVLAAWYVRVRVNTAGDDNPLPY